MAIKKHHISKPTRSPRRPGESAIEWTVRTAWLCRAQTGKWVIRYTVASDAPDGKTTYRTAEQSTRATTKGEAEDYFTRWRDHALNLKQQGPARHTFRDVVEAYGTTRTQRFSGTNDYKARRLCDWLGDEAVDTIRERRLDELHTALTEEGYAPGTVRNFMAVLLTLLRYAERNGMLAKNAVPDYRMPPPGAPRPHALTEAREAMAFAAAAAWSRDTADPLKRRTGLFVCLALDTAQRREAILGLTWERIDLDTELIDFTDPKHMPRNKRRCAAMPIMPRLMDVLRDAARGAAKTPAGAPTGLVFPTHRITEGFARFRATLGLPDWFTPHVCRHTWVTLAMGTQLPLTTISDLTGDSVATLQKTYTHVRVDTHRENLKRFLRHVQPEATQHA